MNKLIGMLGLCFFISCAHSQKFNEKPVAVAPGVMLTWPQPKDILKSVQLVQLLKVQNEGKTYSQQTILTAEENKLGIVGLMPLGGELFRIEYSPDGLVASKWGGEFDLRYALADLILVYADKNVLMQNLGPGIEIKETTQKREILKDSQKIIEISYSSPDRTKSDIVYRHLVRHYTLSVKLLSVKAR